jgi:hypothetical protein
MSFKATTKDIQATEEASQGTLPFLWTIMARLDPDPDP